MVRRAPSLILAISLATTALLMLFEPLAWYELFPGVAETGPFNSHFVRDIGAANLVISAVLFTYGCMRVAPRSALVVAAGLMGVHMLIHAAELLATPSELAFNFLRDLPAVYLPTVLVIWIASSASERNAPVPNYGPCKDHQCRHKGGIQPIALGPEDGIPDPYP